jgi:hypothetical protein
MKSARPSHHRRRKAVVLAPEEYMRRRRAWPMDRTARLESQAQDWAQRNGCTLRVLNGGHHWLFQKTGFAAEWWPSSAKLVINRDYLGDHHAPHWPEVQRVMDKHLRAVP